MDTKVLLLKLAILKMLIPSIKDFVHLARDLGSDEGLAFAKKYSSAMAMIKERRNSDAIPTLEGIIQTTRGLDLKNLQSLTQVFLLDAYQKQAEDLEKSGKINEAIQSYSAAHSIYTALDEETGFGRQIRSYGIYIISKQLELNWRICQDYVKKGNKLAYDAEELHEKGSRNKEKRIFLAAFSEWDKAVERCTGIITIAGTDGKAGNTHDQYAAYAREQIGYICNSVIQFSQRTDDRGLGNISRKYVSLLNDINRRN